MFVNGRTAFKYLYAIVSGFADIEVSISADVQTTDVIEFSKLTALATKCSNKG